MNAIEFAIEREIDAGQYYIEQANKSNNDSLRNVWLLLAKDEKTHEEILEKAKKNEFSTLNNSVVDWDNIIGKAKIKENNIEVNKQIDCYKIALENEKESIKIYTDLLATAKTEQEEKLFRFLINEEEKHHQILDQLIQWFVQSNEKIESAEFGIRDD